MDRVGTQARKAARAQSVAARRHRHDFHVRSDGQPPAVPAGVRYVITLDADTRLPRGAAKTPDRQDGSPAEPPDARPPLRPRHRRSRGASAAGHAVIADRPRRIAVPARLLERERLDPYALRGLRRVSGSVRRRLVLRQGDLRCRSLRSRARRAHSREHAAQSRSSGGDFRAGGLWFPTSRSSTNFPRATTSPRRASIAGRAAIGNCCPGFSAGGGPRTATGASARSRSIGRWKMIDNLRRSLSAPACFLALLGGWTLPFASAGLWSAFILTTIAIPALLPFLTGIVPRRLGLSQRIHLRAVGADLALALSQIALLVTFLRASGLGDVRRDPADAVPPVRVASESARMGYRRSSEGQSAARSGRILPADGRRRRPRRRRRRFSLPGSSRSSWPVAAPFVDSLAVVARCRAMDQACRRRLSVLRRSPPRTRKSLRLIARRTWRFFETFVTAEDHMLPPDNFQEDPVPVVAHRTSPTNLGLYLLSVVAAARFRLDRNDRDRGAAGGDPRIDERARALPRSFLQLVRHARSSSAGSEIYFLGR